MESARASPQMQASTSDFPFTDKQKGLHNMSKLKSDMKSCKDVFNAFLVTLATYAGIFEFPVIQPTDRIPNRLIPFSKAVGSKDFDQWVHFYEFDYLFERVWRDPRRYLPILRRFNGVILPDFSVYRDMPLVMQLWNIYRSRAIGFWLQANGVEVIVNVRWGDLRTYRVCCDGAPKGGVIAVGTVGAVRSTEDRLFFAEGLAVVARRLNPKAIVVYGSAPEEIFDRYREAGIEIVQFASETSCAHKEVA